MLGWSAELTADQTAHVSSMKQVVHDGFKAAIALRVPKIKAGILVDETFGTAILRGAADRGHSAWCPIERSG